MKIKKKLLRRAARQPTFSSICSTNPEQWVGLPTVVTVIQVERLGILLSKNIDINVRKQMWVFFNNILITYNTNSTENAFICTAVKLN